MQVFICEDEKEQLFQLAECVRQQLLFKDFHADLALATSSPLELLEVCEQIVRTDSDFLFFLDIDLKAECDGIQLAGRLKELYPQAKVVFITTHDEMMSLVFKYKIEALDYLIKGETILAESISQCLTTAFERFCNVEPEQHILINSQSKQIRLPLDQVLFFESSNKAHRITVHLFNRQLDFYGKLKEIPLLNGRFLRVHQSYVVHLDNIEYYDQKNHFLVMKNEEQCLVSVRYLRELKERMGCATR